MCRLSDQPICHVAHKLVPQLKEHKTCNQVRLYWLFLYIQKFFAGIPSHEPRYKIISKIKREKREISKLCYQWKLLGNVFSLLRGRDVIVYDCHFFTGASHCVQRRKLLQIWPRNYTDITLIVSSHNKITFIGNLVSVLDLAQLSSCRWPKVLPFKNSCSHQPP